MKFTKYLSSIAAAAIALSGCAQLTDRAQMYAPEDIVRPVLYGPQEAVEITPENLALGTLEFSWDHADFGVPTQIDYSLLVSVASADSLREVLASGMTDTTNAVITYEVLNTAMLDVFEIEPGNATGLNFYLAATVGSYGPVYSDALNVTVTPSSAEKVYPKMWVIGSYCSWSHDNSLYLFDFTGEDDVYQGIIDFGEEHQENEFKLTPAGNWDSDYGLDGTAEAESAQAALAVKGANIDIYTAKQYYHFTVSKSALKLTKNISFDKIGLIGDFNSWSGDLFLNYDKATQVFYADVEIPAAGGVKFRADSDWANNWGVNGMNSDNIPVEAGNYRVYFNMNDYSNVTYEFNAEDYGKPVE